MEVFETLAKHVRQVYFGGNWSDSNIKDQLQDVALAEAQQTIGDHNSIVVLLYHMHYYIPEVTKVFRGGPLEARDKYSFETPIFLAEEDWESYKKKILREAEAFAKSIEQADASLLNADFSDAKYGSYISNVLGLIEHLHYHLGQIVLLKKLICAGSRADQDR